ncbi:MAG: hypothetical protein K1X54_04080 [Flavobacteriales bacterium]|nr:hypothetical protein [Flavobacteriales bacterium]
MLRCTMLLALLSAIFPNSEAQVVVGQAPPGMEINDLEFTTTNDGTLAYLHALIQLNTDLISDLYLALHSGNPCIDGASEITIQVINSNIQILLQNDVPELMQVGEIIPDNLSLNQEWSVTENILLATYGGWNFPYVGSSNVDHKYLIYRDISTGIIGWIEFSYAITDCPDDPINFISIHRYLIDAVATNYCSADLNFDGSVDHDDLLLFLNEFGCQTSCSADINLNSVTDTADLMILISEMSTDCFHPE